MIPSKEVAIQAQQALVRLDQSVFDHLILLDGMKTDLEFLRTFLNAVASRLPTEAALEKERVRKNSYYKRKKQHPAVST